MMRIARPGPRERLAPDDLVGQAELLADPPHLVLEQPAQRLAQLEVHVLGQAADVVVRLDLGRRLRARLDHVGVERALDEEAGVRRSLRDSSSNTRMNVSPMRMRFVSGSVTPASCARKRSEASTCTSGTWKWSPNVSTTCSASPCAQQAVVDEHAGQLLADGAVHEQRGHGGVDAAGEAADHAARRRPARGSARPARRSRRAPSTWRARGRRRERKFLSMSVPRGRVLHLGMELHGVEPALGILHRGHRRRGRRGGDAEAVRARARPRRCGSSSRSRRRPRRAAARRRGRRARSCRTRRRPCARRRRRAPRPWPACRSRCRAPGSRARAGAGRAAARRRRRSRPGRRRGSARTDCARAPRRA